MKPSPDADEASQRLQAADEWLAEAESLLRDEHWSATVHHAYYAAFNAARGLLATVDSRPKTHKGVLAEIQRVFVREGRMSGEVVALLEQALETRLQSDYGMTRVSAAVAEQTLDDARRFVEAVKTSLATR